MILNVPQQRKRCKCTVENLHDYSMSIYHKHLVKMPFKHMNACEYYMDETIIGAHPPHRHTL